MEENKIIKLAELEGFASVEACSTCKNEVIKINFLNTSIKMCRKQFHLFAVLLNEAMIKLGNDDEYFMQMKELLGRMSGLKPDLFNKSHLN
jgi:hypothetical protein